MKKLERKKNEFYNEVVLDRFEESLKRDKSKDIIRGNMFLNGKDKYEKLFVELFYEKIKEFFVEYIDKMNNDNKSLFIEINKKRIRVNKMF